MKVAVPLRPALRVATAATLAVGLVYVVIVAGILTLVSKKLIRETDSRLAGQLIDSQHRAPSARSVPTAANLDSDDAPVYFWRVTAAGRISEATPGSPTLPPAFSTSPQRFPRTGFVSGRNFRFDETSLADGSRLFDAESLTQEQHVRNLLLTSALVLSPVLLGGVFVSALGIGRQASKPVEQARLRQLEFTADASHELRTPLSVIEAEVGLALGADRTAAGYREALQRIAGESHRLRRIVDDLLWLARFDSEPPPPQTELVDVVTVARQCADRFEPIVRSRHIRLDVEAADNDATHVAAAPEWVDRLIGVLLDNAIRYTTSPGRVVLRVTGSAAHVAVTVEDDGPGIPESERDRLFDRFHRIDDATGQGAGLGLAIADAVVRSTHGRWTVGDSPLGGACITVTWPQPRAHSVPRLAPARR
jgi:two-component system sensor histidine kinase CiaH